ncbi:indolepyruvate ferredoxin oxidoreductase family protein [Novosphingobium sp. SG707]|uniref:indolepyruvate ferredoxin oxidoreductase family protein n=1 Tax=Novosphingobium sp. SG707 TaxID=2586996 RepID=UPI00144845EE|nr:indolepyruvate ferredoxin oxidoreductase family protein [Novosphingobium sp. SG707]NKJ00957.1 indolepyruvate ferredoxin oxidoreductase [Novosphingobium sp. SG707]
MSRDILQAESPTRISLDDKWTIEQGRVLINGTQALARVLLVQKSLDVAAGLNTAGYISGYRGSPLGGVDTTLWSIANRLTAADIRFVPGVNEDVAATAVLGTQQLDSVPDPLYDGVFAAWYGKGPGVDRSGDALKHGNLAGAHPAGGVVVLYGDDHGGKSSTTAHQSEQAVAAALIPSLYPADVGEILDYGLLGFALSRYSGSWVGLKLVNEVVEQTATVDINLAGHNRVLPTPVGLPPEGVHIRTRAFNPMRADQIVSEYRLPLVQRFIRANRIDRTVFRGPRPRLGLVTAGKSYGDTRRALELLGLDDERAAALGVSLYKLGCIWPLEPEGLTEFAVGHETLLVIEEKKSFVELQAASVLVNLPDRPRLIGKRDENGHPLLPSASQLEPVTIARAILGRLTHLRIADAVPEQAQARFSAMLDAAGGDQFGLPRRTPYFCSGCPHSRSTRIPDGSLSMTGIGCHTMALLARPQEALPPTQMGGEGGNWLGLAPFTGTRHMFQNMGDGTYYHSGLLAIRAAVASGVAITYKILYNDAVAMTGGQPIDGPISVAEIAQQVRHEGVRTIVVVSDNPDVHRGNPDFPADIRIEHRDDLDVVQRKLQATPGCTVLIYEQTCAAEKRRRRKRGTFPNPPKRLFISKAVCEGCGDCSVQSTCVSLTPVETDFGTKRAIDQASCNKDYSCLNGFCPSFVTVHGAEPRKPQTLGIDPARLGTIDCPARAPIGAASFNMLITGIGGTGVTTVAAVLGMAAHIDGLAASLFDMTGLAQKNGAVFSHIRIAKTPQALNAQRLGRSEADVLLAFDLVAALSDEASLTLAAGRTQVVVNTDVSTTVAFQFNRDATIDTPMLLARLAKHVKADAVSTVDATSIATSLLGDSIGANFFMVGVTAQNGLLPFTTDAVEQAITLNGTAVAFNLSAFRLGRLFASDPERVKAMLPQAEADDQNVEALIARRAGHLVAYQNRAYAERYKALVAQVEAVEAVIAPDSVAMTRAVAQVYAKFLAYKDEYEVARLLTSPALVAELKQTFADGATFSFNLAPPILAGRRINGRPRKYAFKAAAMTPFLTLLARCKRLRGTAFDPFGYFDERRRERALIVEYEALVDWVLSRTTVVNYQRAVQVLALGDMVRGFGPVKDAAMAAYASALEAARIAFLEEGYVEAAE